MGVSEVYFGDNSIPRLTVENLGKHWVNRTSRRVLYEPEARKDDDNNCLEDNAGP